MTCGCLVRCISRTSLCGANCGGSKEKEVCSLVLDVLFVVLTVVFFVIALAYVRGCEKLQ